MHNRKRPSVAGFLISAAEATVYNPFVDVAGNVCLQRNRDDGMRRILTSYGRREIALATMAGVVAAVAVGWLFVPATVLPLAVWFWVVWFFRDPNRRAPSEPGILLSPADGHVRDITPVGADSELGRAGVKIGIFMSVFDVHVNRCPTEARVESVIYRPGVFLDARDPAASERNESATLRLICQQGQASHPVIVRQVAGLIARRIVTDVAIGQELAAGQRIGMIKFGSRVELIVPTELAGEIRVSQGQKVRAGETVLVAAAQRTNDGP